jgi:aminoglycoside phosphotransferase (APT) family kinase protein
VNAAGVEDYLRRRLDDPKLQVNALRQSYPGISRETWLVDVTPRGGLVFRLDTPGGSVCPTPLEREYEVYRRLQGTSVPVPPVLWYETDEPKVAEGRDFYVRTMVDGVTEIPELFDPSPGSDQLRVDVGRELVTKLAALHNLDWQVLGFGEVFEVPPDAATCAAFDLNLLEDTFDRLRVEPYPVIREIFAWLRDHPPPPAARVSLCKGNNGLSEEIWRDTSIVAMSDWELAHLGDPVEDWVSIELNANIGSRGIDPRFDEPALRTLYEDLTGVRITDEALGYYDRLRAVRSMVNFVSAARLIDRNPDVRGSTAGLALAAHRSAHGLARQVGLFR